tara:strand:- start:300 stop:686 length:387 start_codon:yes stop_codon:yes gene_type:complete
MRKILLSFLLISSTNIFGFSESFVCSWSDDNKINQLLLDRFERKDNDLFEISGDLNFGLFDSDYFEVVEENEKGLTLIEEIYPRGKESWVGAFEVIILDKENKLFTYTTTWIYNPSRPKVISGKCLTI